MEPGDAVRARRALWHVATTRRERDVALLRLHPAGHEGRADRTLVEPFDRVEHVAVRTGLTRVSRRHAVRALAALVGAATPFSIPASAATAPARLLSFQLEPLLALRAGVAARILIADHVGLGKTIQAALIARDLVSLQGSPSILILTPAGLREQWQHELRDRAGLASLLVDAETLRARAATRPPDANPWRSALILIASIDFVKQADVLHGLRHLTWDLLIVDEAHTLTVGSDRLAAAHAIASCSDRLVLLTATPHDGREGGFHALCELGRAADADVMAVFRRTRAVSGAAHRRVTRRLAVRPHAAEQRLHVLLERYARRVWTDAPAGTRGPARLAMTVLFKRAASSPASLLQSLERRRALVTLDVAGHATQSALPFTPPDATSSGDEDAEPDGVLAAPGLERDRERTWLNLLIHAASTATRDECKVRALVRLVRRVREPLIVFTEYRDTLARLEPMLARVAPVVTIHGGKTPDARAQALGAFDSGTARVLVATDAASEGLNLQHRCRLVVHVELPWSPTRLEQRIGRVDRLGQQRTVHALNLVARDTVESHIETRLGERARRIRDALDGGPDTGPRPDAVTWLGAAIRAEPAAEPTPPQGGESRPPPLPGVVWPHLRDEADRAVGWLESVRRLAGGRAALPKPPHIETTRGPLVASLRRFTRRHGTLPSGPLYVFRTRITRADGMLVEQALTLLHVGETTRIDIDWMRTPLSGPLRVALDRHVAQGVERRSMELSAAIERAESMVRLRRRAAAARASSHRTLVQLPLFGELAPPSIHEDHLHGARDDEGGASVDTTGEIAPGAMALRAGWQLALVLLVE